MLQLYWLILVSDSLGFIMGTEYHIDNTKTTWEKANELCKRNGTILAEPSHSTITELAERLRSLGYTNSDRFWIGLTFNPATSQFVWSTGDIAQQNLVNLTCGKFAGSLRRICYVLTNIDHSSSPCFLRWSCQDARYGYICQNGPEAKTLGTSHTRVQQVLPTATTRGIFSSSTFLTAAVPSTALEVPLIAPSDKAFLSSSTLPALSSTALDVLPRMTASTGNVLASSTLPTVKLLLTAPSSRASLSSRTVPAASSNAFENLPTASTGKILASNTVLAVSSNALEVLPTASTERALASSSPSFLSTTALEVRVPTLTAWKAFNANITSNSVKRHSNYPLLDFYRKVASLNPQDPLSLKLLTDVYQDFIHALQENSKTEIGEGIMLSARAIEVYAFKYASFNLNASKREERKENQHIVIHVSLVPKGYADNFTFSGEDNFEEVAKITLPSSSFRNQDTIVVNTLYLGLDEYFYSLGPSNKRIGSSILGSSLKPYQTGVFRENVTIVLRTLKGNEHKDSKKCVFWKWNYSYLNNGSWSGDGCSLVKTNGSHVVCTCNHLTNFAILINIKPQELPEKHQKALTYITYIGLGISLVGETITIVAYMLLLCSNNDQQSHVHMNLVATLAMAQVIFLAGIDTSQDQVLCLTVAALLHYFCLSAFCWMLIEGIMLYLLIIEVYNNELNLRLCYSFSFGIPGLLVGVTLLIAQLRKEGIYQYKASRWCWLSTENYYIWSFAAPVILITSINAMVFCGVVKEMVTMPSTRSRKFHAIKTTVKACIVLFPLLGVTWLFGLLSLSKAGLVSQYVFTVLNTLQGLLIFLLHCIRNSEIRAVWNKKLQNVKRQAWNLFRIGRPPATTSSTPEAQSYRAERSEMEMSRRNNKIAPVDG
ncbi:adhesion G-protein coupled receptor D1-like [Porites lutea]|uniref:adhesion G-protein coupled receptor D1-like n=1 Tax=Porites lutea TaxID=51062 RepID=UPI003CC63C3A